MTELICLILGLSIIYLTGYLIGRYRHRLVLLGLPPALALGVLGFAAFSLVRHYSVWWSYLPFVFSAAGFAQFAVSIGAGAGARAGPLWLLTRGTEAAEQCYAKQVEVSAMLKDVRLYPEREALRRLAIRNGASEEQFEHWAAHKGW